MLLQALLILWCTISEACHFAAMCDFPQMFFQYDCLLSNPLAVVKLSSIYQAQHKGAHNAEPAIYRFLKKLKKKQNKKTAIFGKEVSLLSVPFPLCLHPCTAVCPQRK